jgi:hypothetical protein
MNLSCTAETYHTQPHMDVGARKTPALQQTPEQKYHYESHIREQSHKKTHLFQWEQNTCILFEVSHQHD